MIRTLAVFAFSAVCLSASDPKPLPEIIPASFVDRETAPMPQAKAAPKPVATVNETTTAIALEWSNPASIRTNVPNDFTLTVRNTLNQPAQRVVVQVRVPEGVTTSAIVPEAKSEQGVLMWEFGTLAGLQSRTIQMKLTTAVKKDLTCQAWVTATGTAATKIAVREPKLQLKVTAPREVVLGDKITLKYELTNAGDDVAMRPVMNLSHESKTILGGPKPMTAVITNTQVQLTREKLEPGQIHQGEFVIRQDEAGSFPFTMQALADAGLVVSESSTIKVLVPKLTVAINGPTVRQMGRKATYTVTVTNGGEVPLKDVTVNEKFPTEFRLSSSSETYSQNESTATWTVGELIPGQAKVFTYEALAICPGPAVHEVKAVGSRNTSAMMGMKTVVEGVPALRMEVVDSADPIEKGASTTYEIKLTNTGTKSDSQVVLECVLPVELKYQSANGPTGHRETNGTIRFEPVSTLAPQTEVVYRVTVKAVGSGDVRFRANVITANLTKPVTKDESTRIYGE